MYLTLLINFITCYFYNYFTNNKNKDLINYHKLVYKYKKLKYANKILHKKIINLEHAHKISQINIKKLQNVYKLKPIISDIQTEDSLIVSGSYDSLSEKSFIASYE